MAAIGTCHLVGADFCLRLRRCVRVFHRTKSTSQAGFDSSSVIVRSPEFRAARRPNVATIQFMAALTKIVAYTDKFLRIRDIGDWDNALNGLQMQHSGRGGKRRAA